MVFGNHEEFSLEDGPYDLIRDFAFFKYDPSKIKFAEVEEIELAKVGLDIKACGNDRSMTSFRHSDLMDVFPNSVSVTMISTSTISKGASRTSLSSRGSAVLDIREHTVPLNVRGKINSANPFSLPLSQ